MSYRLFFLEEALQEWHKLDYSIKSQLKKKLIERCKYPHIQKHQLAGMKNCYKIKLRAIGYRLVYDVIDDKLIVRVIAVGRRDKDIIYKIASSRLNASN